MGYSPWGRKESDMTEHTHTQQGEVFEAGELPGQLGKDQRMAKIRRDLEGCLMACSPKIHTIRLY